MGLGIGHAPQLLLGEQEVTLMALCDPTPDSLHHVTCLYRLHSLIFCITKGNFFFLPLLVSLLPSMYLPVYIFIFFH